MSASEALTIWMLRTAMKAPSVEPTTAVHMRSGLMAGRTTVTFEAPGDAAELLFAAI
jgi:hypothetical protein